MYKIKEIIKKNQNRIRPEIQQFDLIASDTIYCKVLKTKNKCLHMSYKKMKKANKIVKELACTWMYVLGNKFIWTTTHIFL